MSGADGTRRFCVVLKLKVRALDEAGIKAFFGEYATRDPEETGVKVTALAHQVLVNHDERTLAAFFRALVGPALEAIDVTELPAGEEKPA